MSSADWKVASLSSPPESRDTVRVKSEVCMRCLTGYVGAGPHVCSGRTLTMESSLQFLPEVCETGSLTSPEVLGFSLCLPRSWIPGTCHHTLLCIWVQGLERGSSESLLPSLHSGRPFCITEGCTRCSPEGLSSWSQSTCL